MNFIILIAATFSCGALLLSAGVQEDTVTLMVLLVICIASEIHKPEEGTLKAIDWIKANLKWICWPLAGIFFVH